MPIYEFHCTDCHAALELLIRGSELPECPKCDSKNLERKLSVISAPSNNHLSSDPQPCQMPRCCGGGCREE